MKCPHCHYDLIQEELEIHFCRKSIGFRIEEDILWLSDGVTEYPLKLEQIKKDLINRKFTGLKNNRKFDRTLKQYSYKVLVPYHTVW
ncbi:MAG: hypothetical protein ACE5DT_07860 [Nitrosopumilus sp.]